ncbi:hypothetical protein MMC17_002427 [Xylographa soralifera]|nr:hypothetical protein [Xylographa soralifera]
MQALRHLPPEFLLPAWSYGQLTQLRWLHDFSGHLNPREEDSKRGEKNFGKPLIRKQYNIDRASVLAFYKIHTADSTKSTSRNRESAFLETQNEGEVRPKDIAYAPGQSNTEARYARHTRQDVGQEANPIYIRNKHQPNDDSRARHPRSHLHAKNGLGPSFFGATKSNREAQSSGLRSPSPITYVHLQPQPTGFVPSSNLEHTVGQRSDAIREYKKEQNENDYRPWGWMSLPSISEQSRENHKRDQDVSVDLRSQSKSAVTRSPVRQQSTTSVFGQRFRRADIQLSRTTGEDLSLGERETDRVSLPVRQSVKTHNEVENGIQNHRESTLYSSSNIAQSRSAKSRDEVDINRCPPQRRIRPRDKTNLGAPPVAEELIHTPVQRELSLLEQLFPEEAKTQSKASEHGRKSQEELPRLPPPEFDELHESLNDDSPYVQLSSKLKTREATINAFRQENTTILLLTRASTALCDADFRRIIPRGTHIEEWRGPGDILKVIPSRNMSNLSPTSSYYLLFSNPAYARAYQNQVIHLHQLAQTYTPTSLDFPMPPPPGVLDTKGQDVYALLQDFTISPPSVRMSLRVQIPPYHANLQRLLENEGYPQLVQSENKTGRAVLFWVDGHQPSALSLRTMLSKDGGDRGLQWGPFRGHGEIEVLHVHADDSGGENGDNDITDSGDGYGRSEWRDAELKPKRHGHQRWIISFEDEAEARRFVRVWHRRPYPFPLQEESPPHGEPAPLVHAEYMW